MNKAGLVDAVHDVLDSTKADAERAVDAIVKTIVETLSKGDDVAIAGLGTFSVSTRAARKGRNPRTGEEINIPKMRVAKFRAAKALKEAVK